MRNNKKDRLLFWGSIATIAILAALLELDSSLDGILPTGSAVEYYIQYAMTFITLGVIFLALKLVKKNKVWRIVMVCDTAVVNILLYHMFVNATFGYLSIMCVLAYPFLYPDKADDNDTDSNNQQPKSSK